MPIEANQFEEEAAVLAAAWGNIKEQVPDWYQRELDSQQLVAGAGTPDHRAKASLRSRILGAFMKATESLPALADMESRIPSSIESWPKHLPVATQKLGAAQQKRNEAKTSLDKNSALAQEMSLRNVQQPKVNHLRDGLTKALKAVMGEDFNKYIGETDPAYVWQPIKKN